MRPYLLLAALLVVGCATTASRIPVTYFDLPPDAAAAVCGEYSGNPHAWGCRITTTTGRVSIVCPDDYRKDACRRHEERHADAGWKHGNAPIERPLTVHEFLEWGRR